MNIYMSTLHKQRNENARADSRVVPTVHGQNVRDEHFPMVEKTGACGPRSKGDTTGIMYHVSCIMYRVSCIVYRVSCIVYRVADGSPFKQWRPPTEETSIEDK